MLPSPCFLLVTYRFPTFPFSPLFTPSHTQFHFSTSRHQKSTAIAVITVLPGFNVFSICKVYLELSSLGCFLNINRSTYYKHFYSLPSSRTIENQNIKQMILHIYADYDKRIGAYKITYILGRDYGIFISVGRVYRLMHSMQLPPISTIKPKSISRPKELSGCYANHLHQAFHQKAPNLVWTSDFTYLKAGGKWYYLCIIMDLFLEKLSLGIYHPDPMQIW